MSRREKLSALLKINGLKQCEFADALHYSRPMVTDWMDGKCEPDAKTMLKMAEILDEPVETIVRIFGEDV